MFKKILSVVICISMMFLSMPFVNAEVEIEDTIVLEQYEAYVNSVIPDLGKLPDVMLPEAGLRITQPLEIMNDNDNHNYAFFLFDQNVCIGELVVSYVEDGIFSSFVYAEFPAVTNAYVNEIPVRLVSFDDSLLLCSGSTIETIVGNTSLDIQENVALQVHSDTLEEDETLVLSYVESTAMLASDPPYSGLPYTSCTLDVPFVANTSVNNEGICWAAATASMIRYIRGYSNTTAMSVYNAVAFELGSASGTLAAVECGLLTYGVSGYDGISDSLPYLTVVEQINNDHPIYMSMTAVDNNGETIGHGVVLCGYYTESDNTNYYQIVDSNVPSGKVWITVSRDTNELHYAAAGGLTYTVWRRSVYSTAASD